MEEAAIDFLEQPHVGAGVLAGGPKRVAGLETFNKVRRLAGIAPRPRRLRDGPRKALFVPGPVDFDLGGHLT